MRRRLAIILLAVISAGAAFAAAEGLTRWLRPGFVAGADPTGNPFWAHDPGLGWFHRPGETGLFARPEFSHRVSINAMGFRDVERVSSAAPPAGASDAGSRPFRIAVFGDSFTWGHGVEDDQVFTRVLERLLPAAEVWNLGVSAYSTDQELLLWRRFESVARPDLVLVMLSRNDFEGNVSEAYGAYPKPRFVERGGALAPSGVPVPAPPAWRRASSWLRRRSAFLNGLAWSFEYGPGAAVKPEGNREEEIPMTLRLLDAFQDEARAGGARFAVALVPSTAHVYFGEAPALEETRFAALREWGRRRGVPVLDLVPAFREAFGRTGEWYHYRQDKHWNAAGHRLAAEALESLLASSGLPGR